MDRQDQAEINSFALSAPAITGEQMKAIEDLTEMVIAGRIQVN